MMSSTFSDEALLRALHAWHLLEPHVVQPLAGGFTSQVWLVEAGGESFIAKYVYQSQEAFESGLWAAELVEQHGLTGGAPLRTKRGALSVLVEGPYG